MTAFAIAIPAEFLEEKKKKESFALCDLDREMMGAPIPMHRDFWHHPKRRTTTLDRRNP
jgi:hypothetical protein